MFEAFEPAPALRCDVECYWRWEQDCADGPFEPIYPDACPELIVHLGQRPSRLHRDGMLLPQPEGFLYSAAARPVHLLATARLSLFSIRFHPWGVGSFSRAPMAQRTDREVEPGDVFGFPGERYVQAIASAESNRERCRIADQFLLSALAGRVVRKRERMGALARWIGSGALTAAPADSSDRTLRRLWHERVGIEPRKYRRLLRFRHALRALGGPGSLAVIAVEAGYADQAHMTREFGRLAGATPACVRRGGCNPVFESFVLERGAAVV